jgi:TPR repeat protein
MVALEHWLTGTFCCVDIAGVAMWARMPRAAMQCVLVALATMLIPLAAAADKRVALVIGNSAYRFTPELSNPKNDAADMTRALRSAGVEVIEGNDLDKQAMERKVRDFAAALVGADVGIFFYAGHGLQVNGNNYLVPVDAELSTAAALEFEMVRLDLVQRLMEDETKTNIIFLDACRNNPLSRNLARALGTRSGSVGKGLAAAESGVGTLISFSTQPGNVALDGTGRNSPYSGSLVKLISTPGEDILSVLTSVRNEVLAATADRQVPWENHALRARFYFMAPAISAVAAPVTPAVTGNGSAASAWSHVQASSSVAMLEAFRKEFGGQSAFYDQLAAERIATVKATQAKLAMLAAEEKVRADAAGRTAAASATLDGADGRAKLSVKIAQFYPKWSRVVGLGSRGGALITEIFKNGAGERAGLKVGDVVLVFDGMEVKAARDLAQMVAGKSPGASVKLERWRGLEDVIPNLRRQAEAGEADSATLMASLSQLGIGVAKDDAAAARWFQKAAHAGDVDAMDSFGDMLASGTGVTKDDLEAVTWYRKASEGGNTGAMESLGEMFKDGRGVQKDEAEAAKWYRKAAEGGLATAMHGLALILKNGRGVDKDEAEAVRWYRKAVDGGQVPAMYGLALMLEEGRGTDKDTGEAARWLLTSIKNGDAFTLEQMTTAATSWSVETRKELQKLLKRDGLYSGPVDGEFGASMKKALVEAAAAK